MPASVLPHRHRVTRSSEFSRTVRRGTRVATPTVVAHAGRGGELPRVGFVVGRSVGNSVVRHRVSRRLRAQVAARLDRLPQDATVIVRALPAAADADSATLGRDLDRVVARLDRGPRR